MAASGKRMNRVEKAHAALRNKSERDMFDKMEALRQEKKAGMTHTRKLTNKKAAYDNSVITEAVEESLDLLEDAGYKIKDL